MAEFKTVDSCIGDLAADYGLAALDSSSKEAIAEQANLLRKALEDTIMDDASRQEMLQQITKSMGDRHKQAILERAQKQVAEASMTVKVLDKVDQLKKGGETTFLDAKRAVTDLWWGEGGSFAMQKKARQADYTSEFLSRLEKKGLRELYVKASENPELNQELFRIIFDMSDQIEVKDIPRKFLDDTQAKDWYEATRHLFDRQFFDKKQAGIAIGKQPNYVGAFRYGLDKIALKDGDSFTAYAMTHIDAEKSFSKLLSENPDEQQIYFQELYKQFTRSGSSFVQADDAVFTPFIKSRMKERELHWKQGSTFEVFKEFGPITDIQTYIAQEIDEASSLVVNYRNFGPDPMESSAKVAKLVTNILDEQGAVAEKGKIFIPGKRRTDEQIKVDQRKEMAAEIEKATFALTEKPRNQVTALGYMMQSLSNMQVATKLGSTAIVTAAPTDVVTTTMTTIQDRGPLEAMKAIPQQVENFGKILVASDKRMLELQRSSMVMVDVTNLTYMDKLGPDMIQGISPKGAGQAIARGTSKYAGMGTKWSGLNWQYRTSLLTGATEGLQTLGMMIDPEYAGNKFIQARINDLNLNSREKEIFKKMKLGGVMEGMAGGDRMMDLQSIFDIDLEEFGSGNSNINKARRLELMDKLGGFANSRAGQASPTPNKRTAFKDRNTVTDKDMFIKSMFLFKNTIFHIGKITGEQVMKTYEAGGHSAIATGAAFVAAQSLGVYMATEIIASALLDQKSKTFSMFEDGDVESFSLDFIGKMSLAPVITDPFIRMIRQRDKWGQSSLVDFVTGPTGSMLRDAENIFKSRRPGKSALQFGMNHILQGSNFSANAISRHAFDYNMRRLEGQRRRDEFQFPDF